MEKDLMKDAREASVLLWKKAVKKIPAKYKALAGAGLFAFFSQTANASNTYWSTGLPCISRYCFGRDAPMRVPVPAAGIRTKKRRDAMSASVTGIIGRVSTRKGRLARRETLSSFIMLYLVFVL